MATPLEPIVQSEEVAPASAEPLLEPGDRLSRVEFERRYVLMPHLKKAELIEGIVYMPSPTRARRHSIPHNQLGTWLGFMPRKHLMSPVRTIRPSDSIWTTNRNRIWS